MSEFYGPWMYPAVRAYPCEMIEWIVGYEHDEGSQIPPIPVRVGLWWPMTIWVKRPDGMVREQTWTPPPLMEVLN